MGGIGNCDSREVLEKAVYKTSLNNNYVTQREKGGNADALGHGATKQKLFREINGGTRMYYNPSTSAKLDLHSYNFPKYAVDYLNYLRVERNLAPGTIVTYANSIQTFLSWYVLLQHGNQKNEMHEAVISDIPLEDLSALTRNDIYDFLAFCANELENSATSRSNKLSALKSFFTYLREIEPSHKIRSNPALEISPPKKEKPIPKFLTIEDAQRLLNVAKSQGNDRDYCILLWFLSCGMRLTELTMVDLRDLRKNGDQMDVLIKGKGRKERMVPLNKLCIEALERYLIDRNALHPDANEQALFLSRNKGRLSRRQVERIVEKYLQVSGLHRKGYNAHLLRHTFASAAFELGGSVVDIGAQLGHESIATTQRYVHLVRQNRKISVAIGDALAGQKE